MRVLRSLIKCTDELHRGEGRTGCTNEVRDEVKENT